MKLNLKSVINHENSGLKIDMERDINMVNQYEKLITELDQKDQVVMVTQFKTLGEPGKKVIEKKLLSK